MIRFAGHHYVFDRPKWLLSILSTGALVCLLVLGIWQLQRLEWKQGLIAAIDQRTDASPLLSLPTEPSLAAHNFYPVQLQGEFVHAHEFFIVRRAISSDPGLQLLTPFRLQNGEHVLVNRGYLPFDQKDSDARLETQYLGLQTITGVIVYPLGRNAFTPKDSPEEQLWFAEDFAAFERISGFAYPPYVVVAGIDSRHKYPRGGQYIISLRNNHAGYALTWFGMALSLLGVFAVYHLRRID